MPFCYLQVQFNLPIARGYLNAEQGLEPCRYSSFVSFTDPTVSTLVRNSDFTVGVHHTSRLNLSTRSSFTTFNSISIDSAIIFVKWTTLPYCEPIRPTISSWSSLLPMWAFQHLTVTTYLRWITHRIYVIFSLTYLTEQLIVISSWFTIIIYEEIQKYSKNFKIFFIFWLRQGSNLHRSS